MSIFTALRGAYSYEDAFRAKACTSQAMEEAVKEWFRLYYRREATEETDPCQQIAYTIVHKLTKTAFGEYKCDSSDGFAQAVLEELDRVKKKAMQQALIGGEAWLKPVPAGNSFTFTVVSRDSTLIFARDGQGVPTDIGTIERTVEGRHWYTLLERRTLDSQGRLTIRNRLYCSELPDTLDRPVPLATLARYEDRGVHLPPASGGPGHGPAEDAPGELRGRFPGRGERLRPRCGAHPQHRPERGPAQR